MILAPWPERCVSRFPAYRGRFHVAESETEARRDARRQAAATWFALSDERGAASEYIDRVIQLRTVGVAAITRIPNLRLNPAAAIDGASPTALSSWRETLDGALLGWTPEGCVTPVNFRSGRMLSVGDDGAIWWGDVYETQRLVSQPEEVAV